jgi:hypothetical protein
MKSMVVSAVGCALVVALAACGGNSDRDAVCGDLVCDGSETAASCVSDCGCGNGIANPGEECDGADFATATCESAVQRGGTLGCTAECTFDVTGCDEYMCGNGIADPGEDCDGSDMAGATCASAGLSGGAMSCSSSCRFDLAGCCNDFCDTANTSVCDEETVQSCVMQANGCLGLELTDCTVNDDVCDDASGTATCMCVDRCPAEGFGMCTGSVAETCAMQADGCLAPVLNADCGTTGDACAVGPQGSTCVPAASGEDCNDPYPITDGQNVIAWNATNADYLTSQPTCNTSSLTGPDVVLAYTAAIDGIVTYSLTKPASARQVVVVSNAACGTVTTASEVSCASDSVPTSIGNTFAVSLGSTYYFYVRDTTSGTPQLASPLVLDIDSTACASFVNNTSNLSPVNGAVLATTSPILSFDLQHPVNPSVGVITLTGDLGTSRSLDLATAPSQVTFANSGRTLQIDPSVAFIPGEHITVSWSGLVDKFCGAPIPPPTWSFAILTPSCAPGTAGMVGTTMARHTTGLPSLTEYYVSADSSATGSVYVGGTSSLYRVPKTGGAYEDVVASGGATSTQLGYSMAIVGSKLFTLDSTTSATTPFLWRLSTSAGVTWNPLGYGQYPKTAGAGAYAMFPYKGRLYIATNEGTSTAVTEIWSVSTTAISLPAEAVLEGTVTGELDCDGITGDDHYFYLTCNNSNDHIVRVDRTTFQPELLTDRIPLNTTRNELHAHDFDGDGDADALYVKSDDETVRYICGPAAAGPFWQDTLVDFGGTSTTGNYGLGFDSVGNVLWTYDDDTQELISIQ